MSDLELFLDGDGIPSLLAFLGWVAFGLVVAPVVPRFARTARMERPLGWTFVVVVFGPLGVAAFLRARRRHARMVAAMHEAGIEPPTFEADPETVKAANARIGAGLVTMAAGIVASFALSSAAIRVVFVGVIVGGAVMAARGAMQREGSFR